MPSRPSRDTPSGNYLLQVAAGAEAGYLRIRAASVNKACRWQLTKILLNLLPGARLVPQERLNLLPRARLNLLPGARLKLLPKRTVSTTTGVASVQVFTGHAFVGLPAAGCSTAPATVELKDRKRGRRAETCSLARIAGQRC
jgi:hypothetical protein